MDIIDNKAILFKQVKLLLQHLNINKKNYSAINNYLSPLPPLLFGQKSKIRGPWKPRRNGKLYKDRFKFIYATEFKDDVIKGLTILQNK